MLYKAYARHFGRDDSRALVWQATTLEMNPTLDPSVVEPPTRTIRYMRAASIGAEFRTDIADFISRAVVEACIEPNVYNARIYAPAAIQRSSTRQVDPAVTA